MIGQLFLTVLDIYPVFQCQITVSRPGHQRKPIKISYFWDSF